MASVIFWVPGRPQGKARARVTKGGHAFTPKQTVQYESLIALAAAEAMSGAPWDGPVRMRISAQLGVPGSWSKKKQLRALDGDIIPVVKPDVDNLTKGIMDAIEGIVYRGDQQVAYLSVEKTYSATPGVWVDVSSFPEGSNR